MTEDPFLEIAHQYKAQIYQRIPYLLGNPEDAMDIIQSTAQEKIGENFMQRLFKFQFYLTTLLAAVLFIVGTATSDDQTDVSKQEIQQTTQKPTIMILGSAHLAGSGIDVYSEKLDDVRAPKRQSEIKQLIEQLKEFKPTKIALEVDKKTLGAETQTNYQSYLNGTRELNQSEIDQIGSRLAKQMGHPKLYCVDYRMDQRKDDPFIPFDEFDLTLVDYITFAKTHNQEHLIPPPPIEGKVTQDERGATWIEPEKYEPIIDTYIRDNEPQSRRESHQLYLRWIARIGLDDEYPGANWLSHIWYDRNLKIFVNLTRITESADDRILLIIGAAHAYLIQQFLEESGDYIIESPLKYLKADDAEKLISEETD